MLDNILDKNAANDESSRVKYLHLAAENSNLLSTVKQLETQIQSLRKINEELVHKSPKSIQILIEELSQQNHHLEKSLFRLVKSNEELSCDILMKNQLICEAQSQFRETVTSFEEKIYELRTSLQSKEVTVSTIEEKANEDKEEPFGATSRVNIMYFNEMNELKSMIDRLNIENSQLKFLNAMKDEELQKQRNLLEKYEKVLGNNEDWKKYKQTISKESSNEQTKTKTKKQQARNKLEEQLTRYDMKYKHLSSTKNNSTPNQINNLKFMVTQFNKENRDLRQEKSRILNNLAIKTKEYRLLQEAYKKISTSLSLNKIQVQFYKENFKELCKVPTERKIKFYEEYYQELLPNLEKKLRQKQNLINYWKHWGKVNEPVLAKCIKSKAHSVRQITKRSNSCCVKYNYIKETSRKVCVDREKEEAVFSFINQTHNVDSMINYTIEMNQKLTKPEEPFNDDISIIIKPKVTETKNGSWKKKKNEMVE